MAVRQMAAVRQVQPKNGVARLQHRHVSRHVRGGTGVRLHVGMLSAKKLLGAFARQRFHHVGELAAAVITSPGIAFRVFVGEYRAGSFQHGFADKIFRSDQLEAFVLAPGFVINGSGDFRIDFCQRPRHFVAFGAHNLISPKSLLRRVECFLLFNPRDLGHPPLVPAAGKRRLQPFIYDAHRLLRLQQACAQRQYVGVVVLTAHLRLVFIADVGGADSGNFVGGDGHSDTAAANQDPQVRLAVCHLFADGAGEVGIIHRFGGMRALILQLPTASREKTLKLFFQLEAGVVGGNGDLHAEILEQAMRDKR